MRRKRKLRKGRIAALVLIVAVIILGVAFLSKQVVQNMNL